MRRSELRRRTPLRTRSRFERGQRLRPVSTKAAEWRAWIEHERSVVMRAGRCEVLGCGTTVLLERHHNFGREREPWSSSHLVCACLCRAHHRAVTGRVGHGLDRELRSALQSAAVEELRRYVTAALAAKGSLALLFFDQDGTEWPANRRFGYVCEVADLNGVEPPSFGSWKEQARFER